MSSTTKVKPHLQTVRLVSLDGQPILLILNRVIVTPTSQYDRSQITKEYMEGIFLMSLNADRCPPSRPKADINSGKVMTVGSAESVRKRRIRKQIHGDTSSDSIRND